jgi:hypothetical protein
LARGGSLGSWGLVGGTQPEVFEDWEDEEGLGAFDLTELEVLALRTTSGTGITNPGDSALHAAGTEGSAGQQQQQQQGGEGVGSGGPETNTPSAAAAAADEYDQQQQQQQFSESVGAAATGGGCHPSGSDDAAVDWMSHPDQGEDDVMAAVSDGHHDDVIEGMSHPPQDDVTSLLPGGVEGEGEGAAVAAAAIATPPPSPPPQEPLTVRQGKKRPLEPSAPAAAAAAAAAAGSEGDSEGEQLLPFHIPEDQQQQQRQQRRRVLTELFGEPTPLMTDDDVSKNRVSQHLEAEITPCGVALALLAPPRLRGLGLRVHLPPPLQSP